MARFVMFCVLLLFCFCCEVALGLLYEGDVCHHNAKNEGGVCKKIEECPSAITELKMGKFPQTCGFDGAIAIICCIGSSPTTTTIPQPTTTTPPVKPVVTTRNVGDRAKQKCQEYEKLGWVLERPVILIPGQSLTQRSICPWVPGATPVIVDGEAAKKGEFPHMALIGYKNDNGGVSWDCGGSLISEDFVVTAAHCLEHREFGPASAVRLGDLNYTDPSDDKSVQQIEIERVYEHPDYDFPANYHDIALLKLATPAKLDVYVKPICLYTNERYDDKRALVTGWGNTEYAGSKSDLLMKAALDIFTTEQCSVTYRNDRRGLPNGVDEKLQLCAGSFTDRKDTCQGDSGGPIQIRALDKHCSYYLLGVTSFGKLCGNQNIPAIYTKIFPHMEWIENIVWP